MTSNVSANKPLPRHSRFSRLALTLFVALIVALSIGLWNVGRNEYWWGTSDDVQVLLRDPMASRTFGGLELVATEQTPHSGLGEKTPGAYVNRWFRITDKQPEMAVQQVAQAAESSGWVKRPETGDKTTWVGTKLRSDTGFDMGILISVEQSGRAHPERVGLLQVQLQNF